MTISKQQLDDTIAILCREFPNCFVLFERRRRPLKIGISADIVTALGDQLDRKLLGLALRHYTGNLHYRMSQKAGVPRIDLDGNVNGAVSEADAASAARDVAGRKAAFTERKRQQPEPEIKPAPSPPPTPPPPPEPPRRDSLAALREAAKRRKAVA
jgi:sRNA-binding protein